MTREQLQLELAATLQKVLEIEKHLLMLQQAIMTEPENTCVKPKVGGVRHGHSKVGGVCHGHSSGSCHFTRSSSRSRSC